MLAIWSLCFNFPYSVCASLIILFWSTVFYLIDGWSQINYSNFFWNFSFYCQRFFLVPIFSPLLSFWPCSPKLQLFMIFLLLRLLFIPFSHFPYSEVHGKRERPCPISLFVMILSKYMFSAKISELFKGWFTTSICSYFQPTRGGDFLSNF